MAKHICLFLLLFSLQATAQNKIEIKSKSEFSIGETLDIHSVILAENRTVNIYLPESYKEESNKSYPVIYLLDGSRDEDFIHIAGLVQFGSFSWIDMIPESIVVGIGNIDRQRDFTYTTTNEKLKADIPNSGESARFISFIRDELQPLIQGNYRTSDTKTLVGQSLGGLLATEILFKHSELFDHYIIVSPSLWWDDESLLDYPIGKFESKKSIYVAVGKEGEVMERVARELYDKLDSQRAKSLDLYFDFLEDKDHGDALHLAVYHAFEKIFKQNHD